MGKIILQKLLFYNKFYRFRQIKHKLSPILNKRKQHNRAYIPQKRKAKRGILYTRRNTKQKSRNDNTDKIDRTTQERLTTINQNSK